ncbi:ABC transporter substrate-binding protein [Moorella sp. Hama-1]|uniref:ABC transporter substrate-binding protein n=1 Tax=Moorella sp. Hama-1 TaxID=2138101 RepID=UPI000D641E46|nr:ABC transporter substrate-binding protein [Moorella sp. Hama-1]MDN5361555.1 hypothetical protein [Moorella sp. (in: firmicutes)]BCV21328.1 ABC transporter substrate-binding protein [Moorella sp. Hama-1]
MKARIILMAMIVGSLLATALFLLPGIAGSSRPQQVAVLMASDLKNDKVTGLKEGLARYNFAEGKNISFITRNAGGHSEDLPRLARDLVQQQPDVLVVTGEAEALAAREATREHPIPVVFVGVGCPVELGLIESHLASGNNFTGVDNYYVQLSGKRLEYFQRLLPGLHRVAVLYDPRVTPARPTVDYVQEVSRRLGLQVDFYPVRDKKEVVATLRSLTPDRTDGVMLLCSLLLESMTGAINPVAIERHLPVMGVSENQTLKGLLASYGMPYREQGHQASRLVAKVLRGQNPATIPVESPANVQFIVNQNTAARLGLELNPAGLACATRIIRTPGTGVGE